MRTRPIKCTVLWMKWAQWKFLTINASVLIFLNLQFMLPIEHVALFCHSKCKEEIQTIMNMMVRLPQSVIEEKKHTHTHMQGEVSIYCRCHDNDRKIGCWAGVGRC